MKRPETGEFAEYYAKYIVKVPGADVLSILESERLHMSRLFAGRSERDGNFRYATLPQSRRPWGGRPYCLARIFS